MNKKILFFCYGSICEPYMINSMKRMGYEVETIKTPDKNMQNQPEAVLEEVTKKVDIFCPNCVFSIDFYPDISNLCKAKNLPYVSFTVNVPINTLFCPELANENNATFLFDYMQYQQFAPANPEHIFYHPLAAPLVDMEKIIKNASGEQIRRFQAQVSFVGSLYKESDDYRKFVPYLSEHTKGYLDGLMEAQMQIPGGLCMKECVNTKLVEKFKNLSPDLCKGPDDPKYVVTHYLLGKHIAAMERERYLNAVASRFSLNLHTTSDPADIHGANLCGPVDSYLEMPIVFANSKINLNITYRAIETGLPQRIWDVLGCGGFLLTTFSEEIPEYFEIGNDLDVFTGEEELIEKVGFYLEHDDLRKQIAQNGYEKVKQKHTYESRLTELLQRANLFN